MSALDLNNVVISQDKALVPKPSLIDGRTERDWLCFISDFASVINFYESTNQLHGNWKPFLLKDPVFLLANISKAKFAEFHTPYLNACTKLETGLTTNANVSYTIAFNQAFDAITEVFKLMERWIYYMQRSGEDYEFKKYIIRQIKKDFSALFWAINAFRENLSTASSIEGIERVEYHIFDNWDEIIWKQSRDKSPFWEILNLHYPLSANSTQDHYNALRTAGDRVFDFFHTVIRHSARAFEELKNKKSRYPDTTLLRAFINLLTVHQEQLNGIAEKHLDFYYKDILQQQNLPATPDSVFLCAGLSKKDATFLLPAGTLFDGGI
ncbi:MAG TPA: hypothetical protein VNY73_11295, partial [Bacteroidia bacterium]|nr:hypothetical protein [Bacteroidia bacterium]